MTNAVQAKPAPFAFNAENSARAAQILKKYPPNRQQSALLPLLDIAQRQNGGWLSKEAMDFLANFLSLPMIKVYEVASFYSMFNLQPVGQHLVQVCTTTPCWLRGSDEVLGACKKKLGIGVGETTKDGKFTLIEVECLGACVNAPMMQINDDFYEDADASSTAKILDELAAGRKPIIGSQTGRQGSAPMSGAKTLLEIKK
jgi:NADH-quinone oxidoreductase E subunit